MRPTRSCIFTSWYSSGWLAASSPWRRKPVLDDLEDVGEGRQGEDAHHHALDAGRDHELSLECAGAAGSRGRTRSCPACEARASCRARPRAWSASASAGTPRTPTGTSMSTMKYGAREAEQRLDALGAEQHRVEVEPALRVLQDGHRERRDLAVVDEPADQVGALVAEEERAQHVELAVGRRREVGPEHLAARGLAPAAGRGRCRRTGQAKPEVDRSSAQRRVQAGVRRVVGAVGGRLGRRGSRWTPPGARR